ncbi:MAG TPA: ATP synthase F1 subunit epsilon, partial [Lachnospiraceae bacterium]|nr:ATP synthase F1 subunit epsilon [Lachnospiraceae bacterium]
MADDRAFALKIITPDRVFYEGEAIMVELRTTEGEIGILKNHIPLTCVVAPGILRIRETDTETKTAALLSGFVEI